MKLKKIIILAICSIVITSNSIYADNLKTPSVDIQGGYIGPKRNTPAMESLSLDTVPLSEITIRFKFIRLLGKTKSEIENTDTFLKDMMKTKYKKVKKKYRFFIYHNIVSLGTKNTYLKTKGIYILNENDVCIGYCFFDQEFIYYRINEPEIVQIKALTKNQNYLKNELSMPTNRISFYEKENGDYIERYAINDFGFYMESFYPKALENNIKTRIKNILNYNYEHSSEKNPNSPPAPSEDDENSPLIDDSENNNPED